MSNVDDFLRYRNDAVALFPTALTKYPLIVTEAGEPEFRGLNVAGIPTYNVPPGFDMNANQVTYRTGYHEPGHEYDAYLTKRGAGHHAAFLAFYGITGTWDGLRAASAALPFPQSWYEDPGEMWADAFADAVAGDLKASLRHAELVKASVTAVALRAFFVGLLPAVQPVPIPPPAPQPAPPPPAPAGFRHMADALYAANIPDGYPVVAGYVDGTHPWSDADFARFEATGKIVVRICIWNNRYDADVIDCEGGNCTAVQTVPWIAEKWRRGEVPTWYGYSDAGPEGYRISDVRAACDAAGVRHPLIWIAKAGDGTAFDPTGDPDIVALQYEYDGTYDVSVIANTWPITKGDTPVTNTTGGDGGSVTPPQTNILRKGQSSDRTADKIAKVGEAVTFQATFRWPSGLERDLEQTVVAYGPGRYIVVMYPPLDPDANPKVLDYSGEPATFVLDVAV